MTCSVLFSFAWQLAQITATRAWAHRLKDSFKFRRIFFFWNVFVLLYFVSTKQGIETKREVFLINILYIYLCALGYLMWWMQIIQVLTLHSYRRFGLQCVENLKGALDPCSDNLLLTLQSFSFSFSWNGSKAKRIKW